MPAVEGAASEEDVILRLSESCFLGQEDAVSQPRSKVRARKAS